MSAHFHKLKVSEVRRETADCVSISFDIPEELEDQFRYKQGQYVTIRTYINGTEIRRSYSLCSSPLNKELRIAVKKLNNGIFSCYAIEHLKRGDEIEAMPPMGRFFTELNEANKKSYVAFAAGSGITPIISIIQTTLYTERDSQFTLVYGNRSRQNIIFKEYLEALKNRFINRFRVIYIFSREKMETPLNFGRIDSEKCEVLFDSIIDAKGIDEFFVCGPEEMIFSVKDFIERRGVARKKIHFELFTTTESRKQSSDIKNTGSSSDSKSKVTIRLDGAAFDFDLAFAGDSILNAALKLGADLPFACKGGVCCTCRAKLLEGEIDMDVNFSLEPEEIAQGFILTCQSHPRTEKVVVDFDFK
jgi:ring-1,2-phenylacetyl-CoA epoxidase subunit PaaE